MNLEFFIAKKVAGQRNRSFTRFILLIASGAIALCLTVMIATTALIAGFKQEITEKIFGFWGHIHITDSNVSQSLLENFPLEKNQNFYVGLDSVKQIQYEDYFRIFGFEFENFPVQRSSEGGIRHVQVFAMKPGIIQTKNQIEGIILKGVDRDFDWSFLKNYIVEGQVFDAADTTNQYIIVSKQTADRLNVGIGDKFIVHFVQGGEQLRKRYEVSGIYKTGLEEYDKKFALVNISSIQNILGWTSDQVAGFEVFIDDIDDLDLFTEYIYYNILPNNLYAENIKEKFPAIFEWLALQNLNEMVIIGLMLVVAIINMITALLILILERTNMIGVLKSLGQSNWSIRKVFLYYAGFIIATGLFWGNLLGLSLCFLQKQFGFIRLSEADYYLSVAPVDISWWAVLMLNIGTLLITLFFLVLPSYLVTRISPVKAIRFK